LEQARERNFLALSLGNPMQLTHKIALKPTKEQVVYFQKAAGTSRFVWNWALAKWKEQYAAGEKPKAMALKKLFNSIKYQEFPWLKEMHRDSHAQPFAYLATAWNRFFSDIKANKIAHEPKFKKKNCTRDSFYVANDKFHLNEKLIYLPKIGLVKMTEKLRFEGKILGATVSRTANRWFVAIQVELADWQAKRKRTNHETIGVDFGIKAAATLSTGESILSPTPLKSALRRLKMRGRSISRKIEAAKKQNAKDKSISNNQKKSILKLSKLHARIANLRADFTHKLSTRLCRENQTVVIEDLHVAGMLKNEKLSRALSDVGFGRIRRQLEYKAFLYDTKLMIADRWYPSSKLCSACHWKNESLTLKERNWHCKNCNAFHDRDVNAALNLKWLATRTALPVASDSVMNDTEIGLVSISGGKVTPVRYECGR
jgi:putative transposase